MFKVNNLDTCLCYCVLQLNPYQVSCHPGKGSPSSIAVADGKWTNPVKGKMQFPSSGGAPLRLTSIVGDWCKTARSNGNDVKAIEDEPFLCACRLIGTDLMSLCLICFGNPTQFKNKFRFFLTFDFQGTGNQIRHDYQKHQNRSRRSHAFPFANIIRLHCAQSSVHSTSIILMFH